MYGGGGITPDVQAGDTVVSPVEVAFLRALGRQVPAFRDALTDYALSLKGTGVVTDRTFAVTPEMREQLWRRLVARGVAMDRGTYDSAAPLINRQLAYEITRYLFDADAEFQRRAADDVVIQAALRLAQGAGSQQELFARAAALPKPTETAAGPSTPPAR